MSGRTGSIVYLPLGTPDRPVAVDESGLPWNFSLNSLSKCELTSELDVLMWLILTKRGIFILSTCCFSSPDWRLRARVFWRDALRLWLVLVGELVLKR